MASLSRAGCDTSSHSSGMAGSSMRLVCPFGTPLCNADGRDLGIGKGSNSFSLNHLNDQALVSASLARQLLSPCRGESK
jgi:hypothetical protein